MVVLHLGHGHTPEAAEGSPGAPCEPAAVPPQDCFLYSCGLCGAGPGSGVGLLLHSSYGAVDRNLCP